MRKPAPWWNELPFVRLLIPFVGAIFCYPLLPHYFLVLPPVVFLIISMAGLTRMPVAMKYRFRYLHGIRIHFLLVSLGLLVRYLEDPSTQPHWLGKLEPGPSIIQLPAELNRKGDRISCIAEIRYMLGPGNKWTPAHGKIHVSLTDNVAIRGRSLLLIQAPPAPIIPGNSFSRHLWHQHTRYRIKAKAGETAIVQTAGQSYDPITSSRDLVLAVLDSAFPHTKDRALAKALLVGHRSEMDKEVTAAYTNTGVVHVIAISGLHLGLIYAVLMIIARPFRNRKLPRLVANLLIMGLLWAFTFICGATPSVVRSAVMFTSLLLGDCMGANNNTGNAFASSAFLMLCHDPMLVYDIGFQLSYAAVGGLLLYNRPLSLLFRPRNPILSMAWNSISTSMAAQVLTTPVVLFHFHQFPLLFIISNLVAVPLSGIILLLLIFVCLLDPLPVIAKPIAWLTALLIGFLNDRIEKLAGVPFAVWNNISWETTDTLLTYLQVILFSMFLFQKQPRALLLFLLTLLTWLVFRLYSY